MKFNILDFLLPRETKFYTLLIELTDTLVKGTTLFQETMNAFDKLPAEEIKKKLGRIKDIEEEGDNIEHTIIDELHKTFITPFDREDIHSLAINMDRCIDILNSLSKKIEMYSVTVLPRNFVEFVNLTVDISLELKLLMANFRNKEKLDATISKIHAIENKADYLFHLSMADLFRNTSNPVDVIKFKELYEHCEALVDSVDYVAKMVRGIVVKQG